jgi:hypothetical protein
MLRLVYDQRFPLPNFDATVRESDDLIHRAQYMLTMSKRIGVCNCAQYRSLGNLQSLLRHVIRFSTFPFIPYFHSVSLLPNSAFSCTSKINSNLTVQTMICEKRYPPWIRQQNWVRIILTIAQE